MKDSQLENSSTPAPNFYVRVVERNSGNVVLGSRKTTIGNFAAGLTSLPKCETIYGGDEADDDITIKGTSHSSPSGSNVILQPTAGNVGIGTTSPGEKLEVNGHVRIAGNLLLENYYGTRSIYTWSSADANWRIGTNASPGFTRALVTSYVQFLTYGSASAVGFAMGVNGGNSSFEIQSSNHQAYFRGNVGIGTVSPATALEVAGALRVSGNGSSLSKSISGAATGTDDATGRMDVFANTSDQNGPYLTMYGPNYPGRSGGVELTSRGTTDGWIKFGNYNGSWSTQMVILPNGNVGVGGSITNVGTLAGSSLTVLGSGNVGVANISPAEKLDVTGNILLSGVLKVGATDTGLGRVSAGVVKVTDGSTGIRALQGGGASVASASTLPLPTGRVFHVTGGTEITNIAATNFQAGVAITLIFDTSVNVKDGGNLKLAGDFGATSDDTLSLIYDGSNWYEISRSVN